MTKSEQQISPGASDQPSAADVTGLASGGAGVRAPETIARLIALYVQAQKWTPPDTTEVVEIGEELRAELAALHAERDAAHAFATEVREALGEDYAGPEAHWRARSLGSIARLRERAGSGTLAFDDALRIARGCTDYGGGYRSDPEKFAAFQHGIRTIINALTAAGERGLTDTQIVALYRMGAPRTPAVQPEENAK